MVNWTGYWIWVQWYLGEGLFKIYGPRFEPKRPKRHPGNIGWKDGAAWWARFAVFIARRKKAQEPPPPPIPTFETKHLIFNELGTYVASASAFSYDSPKAIEFRRQGGKWLAIQFWDPATHAFNLWECQNANWINRWRAQGVKVFGWHRVEHFPGDNPFIADVEGWSYNPESQQEMESLTRQIIDGRSRQPTWPLSAITLGKMLYFPTGLLTQLDIHLIMENFIQEGGDSDDITSSYKFWRDSMVPHNLIHSCLLFKPGIRIDATTETNEAKQLGIKGISAFTGENTPISSWATLI